MKKILFAIIAISGFLVSCQKSNEDKAAALIKDSMNKTLYHPETYEGVETQLDSAFAPFDSPEFYETTLKVAKLGVEISQAEEEMKDAKSSMSIWSGPYQTAFGRNEYNEAKEKYDNASAQKDKATEKAQKLADQLKTELQKEPVFIGFKARHKYRANNNAGNTVFGEAKFVFDKELTQVIAEYDMEGEEYLAVQQLFKMMTGEEE